MEESLDGMDFVAGAIFEDAEEEAEEEAGGTNITFRMGYYLPGTSSFVSLLLSLL